MTLCRCVSVALLAGSVSAPAQDGAATTRNIAGQVLDAEGKPAAGADVTFVAAGMPGERLTRSQPIRTRTDAAGKFELTLPGGRVCSGFGAKESAASTVVEFDETGPAGARTIRLEAVPRTQLTVTGSAAWRNEGPLHYRLVVPATAIWTVDLAMREGEALSLPVLPRGELFLEVRSNQDETLALLPVDRSEGAVRVALPAPVEFTVEAGDAAGGALAGAQIAHRVARRPEAQGLLFAGIPDFLWRALGKTDGEGRLRVRLSISGDPFTAKEHGGPDAMLAVEREGSVRALLGWDHGGLTDDAWPDAKERVLRLRVPAAVPYRVTLHKGDQPVAGEDVMLLARSVDMHHQGMQFLVSSTEHRCMAKTDDGGVATFTALPLDVTEFRLLRMAGAGPRCIPLPQDRRTNPELDLDDCGTVSLRITGLDQHPANVRGIAMPSVPNQLLLHAFGCESRLATDTQGRASLSLCAGRWWIFVDAGEAFAHQLVEVSPGKETAVALTLRPYASWTLQLADAAGKAAAGASFDGYGKAWIEGTPIPEDLLPRQFLGEMDSRIAATARSDGQGRLVLRFTPPEVATTFGKVRWCGKESEELHLRPGSERRLVLQ